MTKPLSLTAVGRGFAVLALIAGSAGALYLSGIDPRRIAIPHVRPGNEAAPIARRLIVYRLDPVRVTEFRFTQPVMQTRIVVHPVLGNDPVRPGQTWLYGFKAELLDSAGGVVATRTVHARATLLAADGTPIGPRRYFRNDAARLAAGDEIRLAEQVPFASLRLTALPSDPGITQLDVRVSERRPLITSAAQSAFFRFSPEDQARLSAPNAFPPQLLTEAERTNIAISQWRPVGPLGIDGRDHVMGVLYEDAASAEAGDDSASDGDEVG